MTFKSKEIAELSNGTKQVVAMILEQEGIPLEKDQDPFLLIDKVSKERKHLLLFLKAVINAPITTAEAKSRAIYGALFVVMEFIEQTRYSKSFFKDALTEIVKSADLSDAQPSLEFRLQCSKVLNNLLLTVFHSHDSRKGISPIHPFRAVDIGELEKLMLISYESETNNHGKLIKSLADNKFIADIPDAKLYEITRRVPQLAIANFGTWAECQLIVDNIIAAELGSKNCGTLGVLAESSAYAVRATQLKFLQTLRKILAECTALPDAEIILPDAEKTAILVGAMLIISKQIADNLGYLASSVVLNKLNENLPTDNLSPQNTEALIFAASRFVQYMAIAFQSEKSVLREKHGFSSYWEPKIKEFNPISFLELAKQMICVERGRALHGAIRLHLISEKVQSQEQPSKLSTALNYLGIWSKTPAPNQQSPEASISQVPK